MQAKQIVIYTVKLPKAALRCTRIASLLKAYGGFIYWGEGLLKASFIENKRGKRDIAPDISFGVSQKKENNTVETTWSENISAEVFL